MGFLNNYVSSWKKNPIENIITGGGVATYRAVAPNAPGTGGLSKDLGVAFKNANPFGPGPKLSGDFSMTEGAVAGEQEALDRLRKMGSGEGLSVTQAQFLQAMDAMAKQRQSAVASARGVANPALLERQAMQGTEQANLDLAQQAATSRLAEQQGANQLLLAQATAQRDAAARAAAAELGARQEDAASRREMVGNLGKGVASIFSGASGGGGQSASDENVKKNVKESSDASKVITEFMDALKSYTYEYKKGAKQPGGKPNPEGEVSGVMAQDLEKTELGKQMVTDTKNGKVVDYAQGMAPLLASIAELNKRLKNLEGKKA